MYMVHINLWIIFQFSWWVSDACNMNVGFLSIHVDELMLCGFFARGTPTTTNGNKTQEKQRRETWEEKEREYNIWEAPLCIFANGNRGEMKENKANIQLCSQPETRLVTEMRRDILALDPRCLDNNPFCPQRRKRAERTKPKNETVELHFYATRHKNDLN